MIHILCFTVLDSRSRTAQAQIAIVSILVTPVFGHKKEFILLNIRKVFGDLEISLLSFASRSI